MKDFFSFSVLIRVFVLNNHGSDKWRATGDSIFRMISIQERTNHVSSVTDNLRFWLLFCVSSLTGSRLYVFFHSTASHVFKNKKYWRFSSLCKTIHKYMILFCSSSQSPSPPPHLFFPNNLFTWIVEFCPAFLDFLENRGLQYNFLFPFLWHFFFVSSRNLPSPVLKGHQQIRCISLLLSTHLTAVATIIKTFFTSDHIGLLYYHC